jgi:hypothetical protein
MALSRRFDFNIPAGRAWARQGDQSEPGAVAARLATTVRMSAPVTTFSEGHRYRSYEKNTLLSGLKCVRL